jgi:hypothetical protein
MPPGRPPFECPIRSIFRQSLENLYPFFKTWGSGILIFLTETSRPKRNFRLLATRKGEKGERSMRAPDQPSLPSGRAFIVQLHAEADIAKGLFIGRVEHIVSYQATHFDSLEALATFMTRVLSTHEAE